MGRTSPHPIRREYLRLIAMAAIIALGISAACRPAAEIQPGDIRTYAAPPATLASPRATSPADRGMIPPAAQAPVGPKLAYELPEGWTDLGASGMRLATLRPGGEAGADSGEITIIPASGTLEGNATRWQQQLTPDGSPDGVSRGIAEAERVTVNGVESTILLLVDDADDPQQAILAAMIPLDATSSLFVKYKGPAVLVGGLRPAFTAFVQSITWD